MKQSLEQIVYEIINMNFKKAGEQILNPNNWEETSSEEQKEAYCKAWKTICEIHSDLFNLMCTIDIYRKYIEFKEETE